MTRASVLNCFMVLATSLAVANIAVAAPIAQPGATLKADEVAPTIELVAYSPRPQLPFCHGMKRPGYYSWNPGRYDSWNGVGPFRHKDYGGHRWHDLYYNNCKPWWQNGTFRPNDGFTNPHLRWCLERYRSYDPRTDTYMGYDGVRHRCREPK